MQKLLQLLQRHSEIYRNCFQLNKEAAKSESYAGLKPGENLVLK